VSFKSANPNPHLRRASDQTLTHEPNFWSARPTKVFPQRASLADNRGGDLTTGVVIVAAAPAALAVIPFGTTQTRGFALSGRCPFFRF
jgi:hypothetical protein